MKDVVLIVVIVLVSGILVLGLFAWTMMMISMTRKEKDVAEKKQDRPS